MIYVSWIVWRGIRNFPFFEEIWMMGRRESPNDRIFYLLIQSKFSKRHLWMIFFTKKRHLLSVSMVFLLLNVWFTSECMIWNGRGYVGSKMILPLIHSCNDLPNHPTETLYGLSQFSPKTSKKFPSKCITFGEHISEQWCP